MHLTKMALLWSQRTFMMPLICNLSTVLVALDSSTAFDCIDPDVMIKQLEHVVGLSSKVTDWIKFYLMSCNDFFKFVGSRIYDTVVFNFGIPPESSLVPVCLTVYVVPLAQPIW
jgi:hypothetical protein